MKISYDYEEIIQELKEELKDGMFTLSDTIQVLRSDNTIEDGYRPIIDWYYDDMVMAETLANDLLDDEEDLEEKRNLKKQYENDKLYLESITVKQCLNEMEEKMNLFK